MLDYFANIEHKHSISSTSLKEELTLKSYSFAAMINGYVDFANVNDIKFFAGVGVGAVRTLAKVQLVGSSVPSGSFLYKVGRSELLSSVAYAVHLGASTKVADKVNVELGYSWRDLGSVKFAETNRFTSSSFPYRGHHLSLGIRYDV